MRQLYFTGWQRLCNKHEANIAVCLHQSISDPPVYLLGRNGSHGRGRSDGKPGLTRHGRFCPADVPQHDSH